MDAVYAGLVATRDKTYEELLKGLGTGVSGEELVALKKARRLASDTLTAYRAAKKAGALPQVVFTAEELLPAEPEQDPFEAITSVSTYRVSGTCPFRGYPFKPELDERCPQAVDCIALPVEARMYHNLGVPQVLVHVVPVLKEDSYCGTCMRDQTRESEAGRSVTISKPKSTVSSGKRVRRR